MSGEWKRLLFHTRAAALLLLLLLLSVYQMYSSIKQEYPAIKTDTAVYRQAYGQLCGLEYEAQKELLEQEIRMCEEAQDIIYLYRDDETETLKSYQETMPELLALLDLSGWDGYQLYRRQEMYKKLLEQVEYLAYYPEYLEKIKADGERIMRGGVFGNADGFSAKNAAKTVADFEKVNEISLSFCEILAVEAIWKNDATGYFAAVYMLYLVLQIMAERKRGLWELMYASGGGRLRLFWARVKILFAGAVLAAGVLYLGRAATAFYLLGGTKVLGAAVQSLAVFQKSTALLNVGQMLALTGIVHGLSAFAAALFFWAVFVGFSHEKLAMGGLVAIVGAEYILYQKISASSSFIWLKAANLFTLLDCQKCAVMYQNYQLGGLAVGHAEAAVLFGVLLAGISLAAAAYKSSRQYPKHSSLWIQRFADSVRRKTVKLAGYSPCVCTEIYKVLFFQRGWIAAAVWLCLAVSFYGEPAVLYYESFEIISDRIYRETSGASLEDAGAYLEQVKEENQADLDRMNQAVSDREAGIIDNDTYQTILAVTKYAAVRQSVYDDFERELERLEELENVSGREIHIVYPFGLRKLTGPLDMLKGYDVQYGKEQKLWMLYQLAVMIFLFAGMFPFERKRKMEKLIYAASDGRQVLWRRKALAAALCVIFMWAAGSVFRITWAIRAEADWSGLMQPAAVLPWFSQVPAWINIGMIMVGIGLMRLAVMLAFAGIILFFSAKSRSMTAALALGLAVLLLPAWIEYLTGAAYLPLAVMQGIQLVYEEGGKGLAGIAGYIVIGAAGYAAVCRKGRQR